MPRTAWKHPVTARDVAEKEELNEFLPPSIVEGLEHAEKADTRHVGLNLTITAGLGCPRRTLIERTMDYGENPVGRWPLLHGTWMHEKLGQHMPDNYITEENNPDKVEFEGKLFGVPISCKVDCYKQDYSELIDWKVRSDKSLWYADPMGRAKPEEAAQLNMQRLLMEQSTGKDLASMRMYIWTITHQEPRRFQASFMTEQEIGMVRPGGAQHSVREILHGLWEAFQAVDQGTPADQAILRLPMVGQYMYRNKKGGNMCTDYCGVQETCYGCSEVGEL